MNPESPPVSREQVEVDGTALSYLTSGNNDAEPLLLLHGTFWSRVWQPVLPALGQHFHCVALDFPGFGRSDGELDVDQATVPALAGTVLRAADALKLDTFAGIGAEALRGLFTGMELNMDTDSAVQHVMAGLSSLGLHADVADGVKVLHAAGYRLVTLTNGSTQVAGKLFTDACIRDSFDLLLSVEDAPAWKPGKAAYEYAATACGTAPGQMLLVAVHPWDIHGAKRAGLQTTWLNRSGSAYPGYFEAPDYTITSLGELASALER